MDGFPAIMALFPWIDFFFPLCVWICLLRHMGTKARSFGIRPELITQERKKERGNGG